MIDQIRREGGGEKEKKERKIQGNQIVDQNIDRIQTTTI